MPDKSCWMLLDVYSKPSSRIFFFVLKPNPIMTNNKSKNMKTSGIFLSAIAIPISAIDKIAPNEYSTKIHLILPKLITSKKNDKKIITLVSLVI